MRQNIAVDEATLSGMVGPFMTGLGRSPLALIRRKPIKRVTGAVDCPYCGQHMSEDKACCKACAKGKRCKSELKETRAVPDCIPLTPPDPDCTLAGGLDKEMKRRNLRLIKRKKYSRKK